MRETGVRSPIEALTFSDRQNPLLPKSFENEMFFVSESTEQRELTDARMVLLSSEITSKSTLRNLATVGLNVESAIINRALTNNKDDISEAAHTVLTEWRNRQPNKSIAYTRICEVLTRRKLEMLITAMDEEY